MYSFHVDHQLLLIGKEFVFGVTDVLILMLSTLRSVNRLVAVTDGVAE